MTLSRSSLTVSDHQDISSEILALVRTALHEDLRTGDITSEACIDNDSKITGNLLMKQTGRVAGLPFVEAVFKEVDPRIKVELFVDEGSEQGMGAVIGSVRGPARGIFSAERVALNLLQHVSGIATTTAQYVARVHGHACDILDTRKTLPGMRLLQKYAVRMGGGKNHRFGLDDRFIIKNNHLAFLAQDTKHPILEAVRRTRSYRPGIVVEVEVETLEMVAEALEAKPDVIMLDNMAASTVHKAVKLIDGKAYIEASGGINLNNIRSYAEAGVNGISIGALTHSVPALDMSLRFSHI
jgi:nicotinate-nucleotide pyrophosphorylase (carboxylating)